MRKHLWGGTQKDVDNVAEWLHNQYEKHSKYHDWETQKDCQVKFDNLPYENKEVMRSLAMDVILRLAGKKTELSEFLSNKLDYSPEFIYDLLKEFELTLLTENIKEKNMEDKNELDDVFAATDWLIKNVEEREEPSSLTEQNNPKTNNKGVAS